MGNGDKMMDKKYYNYHKHDHKGNVCSLDVVSKLEDYCKRAVELGHDSVFTTNHGMQGDMFEAISLGAQYKLKVIMGAECYYVPNRFEKERSNRHIIIICLNDDGVRELNYIISMSNVDGFYYKPRIDDELLFSLNPDNFIITTACVAGLWSDEELIIRLKNHFKSNLYLEVQNHNVEIQINANKRIVELSKKLDIKLIHGNDSHYIFPKDDEYRDLFLKGKGIIYEQEDKFILDYPDYDTIVKRYNEQGVLNQNQIKEALNSTLVFEQSKFISLINEDIKLPSISKNPNKELKEIINEKWKLERNNIPKEQWKMYLDAIKFEMDIIEKTKMEDYFLIDYNIVKIAQEKYSGTLTNTGRGSAPSFYSMKLLGLTDLDRIISPITLFPTRFMSIERILGARSLPDVDLNTADSEPFIMATEDLLGKENCAWMISWKPLQESSGFRLYCKAIGLDINEYNEIAKEIDKYRNDKKWGPLIELSKPFIGVVEGISESPCSMLLYDKMVSREIGLVRTSTKICCLLDGYNCDKYKYLKNDYLTVMVWGIIKDTCDLAGIKIPTISELDGLLDDKSYDIYKDGLTCSINQADSDWATSLVKRFKPQSPSEMSAFVAIIRPGCASLLEDFIDRKPYTTGVDELDAILNDSAHRLIYQESLMKYFIWLGVTESHSYDIIKKVAKKKFKEKELIDLKAELLEGWMKQVKTEKGFNETWQVVEDAAKYSFNASHSLSYAYDSLYGAYLKSHYPLEYYTVSLNYYNGDEDRTERLISELKHFAIKLEKPSFRYSRADYFMNREKNTIYKGTSAIKFLNPSSSEYLYSLRSNTYPTFIALLTEITQSGQINSRQIEILITLQYFKEFGGNKKLLTIYNSFKELYGRKQLSKDKLSDYGLTHSDVAINGVRETEKQYVGFDMSQILNNIENRTPDENISVKEQVSYEADLLGYISATYDVNKSICFVLDLETKYSPKAKLYSLGSGREVVVKITKGPFSKNPFQKGDIICAGRMEEKFKSIKTEDGFQKTEDKEWWMTSWKMVNESNWEKESCK